MRARVHPDLVARDPHGQHVGLAASAADSGRRSPRLPRRSCRPRSPRAATVRSKMPAESSCAGQRQVARVARQQAALPVRDAFAGVRLVLFFGLAKDGELRVPAVDQVGVGHQLRGSARSATAGAGYSTQISASDSGCGLNSSTPSRRARAIGLRLRLLHRVQHRVEQVERDHHQDAAPADSRPAVSRRCRRRAARSRPSAAADRRGTPRRSARGRCSRIAYGSG